MIGRASNLYLGSIPSVRRHRLVDRTLHNRCGVDTESLGNWTGKLRLDGDVLVIDVGDGEVRGNRSPSYDDTLDPHVLPVEA